MVNMDEMLYLDMLRELESEEKDLILSDGMARLVKEIRKHQIDYEMEKKREHWSQATDIFAKIMQKTALLDVLVGVV